MDGGPERASLRVLHVDDDEEFAALAAEFLEREHDDIDVLTAGGPEEGRSLLAEHEVACVVSDYDMPEENGIEFLETVRAEYPELPFVLFTGKGSETVASEAVSAGVTDYLQKETGPDQFTVLANRIENAVEGYRAERRLRERERELEQENRRFSALFENIAVPVAYYEFEGDHPLVRAVNPAFEETFGVEEAEVEGRPLDDVVVPPAHVEEGRRINERVRAGEVVDVEVERAAADGLRTFNLLSVPIRPGESGERGFTVYTDVTDRKERERELRRYEMIVEASPDEVFVVDDEGVLVDVYGPTEQLTGFTAEQLRGEPVHMLVDAGVYREAATEKWTDAVRTLLSSENDAEYVTYRVRADPRGRDPQVQEVRVSLLPFEDAFRGTAGVVRDVTDLVEEASDPGRSP